MLCVAVLALVVIVRAWDCAPGYAGPSQCNHGGCFGHIVQHGTPVDNDCSNNGVWHEWGPGGTRGSGYFQWEQCTYPDGHFAKCCNCWKVQDDLDFSSVAEIVEDARNAINSTASLRGSLRQSLPETQTRNVATLPNDDGAGNSSNTPDHLNGSGNTSSMVANASHDQEFEDAHDELDAAFASSNSAGCHASTHALRDCGTKCFARPAGGTRAHCVSGCLHDHKHLDHSCAACYGQSSDCTMTHCLSPCAASASGHSCTSCVHRHCGGSCGQRRLEEVSGQAGVNNATAGSNTRSLNNSIDTNGSHEQDLEAAESSSFVVPCFAQSCYNQHKYLNCYSGRGAIDIDHNNIVGVRTLAECGLICSRDPNCHAFVFMFSQQKCWRRASVDIPYCERGRWGQESSEFDTFVKKGATTCHDLPGVLSGRAWFDGTNGCQEYASNGDWCARFGAHDYNGEGAANNRCCACGGGSTGGSPAGPQPPAGFCPMWSTQFGFGYSDCRKYSNHWQCQKPGGPNYFCDNLCDHCNL